jgi:hypothetical protein
MAAGLAASAQPARSARWPAGEPILVWVDSARVPPGAAALVDRALKTWTDAADGRVTLQKAATSDAAKLRIRFISSDTNFGETLPRIDRRTGAIVEAEVAINADAPGDALTQRIVIYLTALHELGHALGLPHNDDFGSIMYRFRAPDDGERYFGNYRQRLHSIQDIGAAPATGLSADDVQALRALYQR